MVRTDKNVGRIRKQPTVRLRKTQQAWKRQRSPVPLREPVIGFYTHRGIRNVAPL